MFRLRQAGPPSYSCPSHSWTSNGSTSIPCETFSFTSTLFRNLATSPKASSRISNDHSPTLSPVIGPFGLPYNRQQQNPLFVTWWETRFHSRLPCRDKISTSSSRITLETPIDSTILLLMWRHRRESDFVSRPRYMHRCFHSSNSAFRMPILDGERRESLRLCRCDGEMYSMSLCESMVSNGGLEIGLSLPRDRMEAFGAIFAKGINGSSRRFGLGFGFGLSTVSPL
ncbi:malonyl CoA:anthocyanin5-O-glucoside-6'''-O-malonyltransferase [Striga asiatica]|uniref:Malonyl CoA:anthocyanin5-O-glucoside-6'''-O-malonyltransferase n=1 Tax=Striga asiatica TaxID=4170 RepID=A0A5A7R787_STRAF|nr:malonyl CoA:anthocyanin5-O-glucoside-6'''-O-malonyltransferase [Striga asiatica]